jgi:hypothetical protein
MKRATKRSLTTEQLTTPAPEQAPQQLVLLTEKLQAIRTDAMRDRANHGKMIAQLQSQREQLEEMRIEIDATIAFLRAQHSK